MGELLVLIALFAGIAGIIEISTKEPDCKIIEGDQLGNVECEDEIQVLEKKP